MGKENALKKEQDLTTDISQIEPKQVLSDYLEQSSNMNMQILKVADLIDENVKNTNKSEKFDREESNVISIEEIKIIKTEFEDTNNIKLSLSDLDDLSRSQAVLMADKLEDEIKRLWKRQGVIRSIIMSVDRKNAFSFIKSIINVSKTRTVFGDIKKYITLTEIRHFVLVLLKQASDIGMDKTFHYYQLKKEYERIIKLWSRSPNKKADNRFIELLNRKIENLFEEMAKHH